jgi:hypothetical protein
VAERGFLMVNLWWIRGELWLVDGRFLGSENVPRMTDLFSGIPIREFGCRMLGRLSAVELH